MLKSLENPIFTSPFNKYQNDKILELKLNRDTVLRKRPVATDPCNMGIENYDEYLQEAVSNETQCIPPFWKNRLNVRSNLNECTTQETLRKIHNRTMLNKKMLKDFDKPCVEMFSSVIWSWLPLDASLEKKISSKIYPVKFIYLEKYYEEIEYSQAFNPESLISNLGGFIGIFLGYSLMQLPELLGRYNF